MEKLTAQRCYEILGLKPGATLAQLREQRGKLAHQWHPDKETDPHRKASLEDKMKDINNAFDFLKAALSETSAGPSSAKSRTPPPAHTPPPAAKKPWEAETEARRKRTAEREAVERRERAARQQQWRAEFQREQADAARQRAERRAEAARLQAWLAQEKEREEQEGKSRDQRTRAPQERRDAEATPPVQPAGDVLFRQRDARPPARTEAGTSKHIYHSGKCTKCGRSKEQIARYELTCL